MDSITGNTANQLVNRSDDPNSDWKVVRREHSYQRSTKTVYRCIVTMDGNNFYYFLYEVPDLPFDFDEEVRLHQVRPREILTTIYEEV